MTEDILQRLLTSGKLIEKQEYSRDMLTKILREDGVEDAEEKFTEIKEELEGIVRELDEPFKIGNLVALLTGQKRGRRYTFFVPEQVEEEIPSNAVSVESVESRIVVGVGTAVGTSEVKAVSIQNNPAQEPQVVANDHPEDRQHIAAHIVLMLLRKCLSVSMPKTTRGGKNENPDLVGICLASSDQSPRNLPDWLNRPMTSHKYLIIGGEIKPYIRTENELLEGVREARHNCRYFDETWLIAEIAPRIKDSARDLGEEYNVGIIDIEKENFVRSETIFTPLFRSQRDLLYKFFARRPALDTELNSLRQDLAKLEEPYKFAAKSLISNQQNQTLVERLPDSIRRSLLSTDYDNLDVVAFANAIVHICNAKKGKDPKEELVKGLEEDLVSLTRDNEFFNKSTITAAVKRIFDNRIADLRQEVTDLEEAVRKTL